MYLAGDLDLRLFVRKPQMSTVIKLHMSQNQSIYLDVILFDLILNQGIYSESNHLWVA